MASITICIPTYNREEFLSRAITSLEQLIVPEEVALKILVSDDSYTEIKKNRVCNRHNKLNINYIKSNSGGQFYNINKAIINITTEWVIILHDDDILYENYLVDALNGLKIFSDATVFWANRFLINDHDVPLRAAGIQPSRNLQPINLNGNNYCRAWLLSNNPTLDGSVVPPMVTGLMFKREIFGNQKLFNENYETMADGVFIYKILALSKSVIYSPRVNVGYRVSALTERSKLARSGKVYFEYKKHLNDAFSFLELEPSLLNENIISKNFSKQALAINGPITWIALHYQGSVLTYLSIIVNSLFDIYKTNPRGFLVNFPFAPLILVFTPRIIKIKIAKYYLGY